jgi:hypothetical protein
MLNSRTFNIVFVSASHGVGGTVSATVDKTITYTGTGLTYNKTTQQTTGIRQSDIVKNQPVCSERLIGRTYVVTAQGVSSDMKVVLVKPSGKQVAMKNLKNNCVVTVAENLVPGVYFVYFKQGNKPFDTKKIIVR